MKMTLTRAQIWKVIDLANGQNTHELCAYLKDIEYSALLDVEALMLYGRELMYGDGLESFEDIYRSVYDEWGGKNGDKEMAIAYIAGKTPLAQYLESAIEVLYLTSDAKISFQGE